MKILVITIILSFGNPFFKNKKNIVSECYSWHNKHYYKLFVDKDTVVFQHTTKDANEISYVAQSEIQLNKINPKKFQVIEQDENYILFCNSDGYYILDVHSYNVQEKGITKASSLNNVTKTAGTSFLYINNQWVYFDIAHNYNESLTVKLPKLTSNLTVVDKDKANRRWLLKDDKSFYSFSDRVFKAIPNLNIETTQFYKTENEHDRNFLFDEDTFYLLDYDYRYQNVTADFKLNNKRTNLLKLSFHKFNMDLCLKENDSLLWAYTKNSIYLIDNTQIYFYPLNAKFVNQDNSLIDIEGNIYFYLRDAIQQSKGIDVTEVKNIKALKKIDYSLFFDGYNYYKFDYKLNKLVKNAQPPNNNSKRYSGVYFYNRILSPFYIEDNNINYYDNQHKLIKSRIIKDVSSIKKLTLAYLYDNKLLIENKEIPNIADIKTLEFLGSTVDIISDCDGGKGQIDITVKYYYFFKDKNFIYSYYSGEDEMKVLENINPNRINTINFKSLKQLESIITNKK